MPNLSLTWTSSKCLPCGENTPAEIVIVVPSSKLAQRNCPIQPVVLPETTGLTSFSYNTLDAVLINSLVTYDSCQKPTYSYVAEFDSDQVVAGQTIYADDILGVTCKGAWSKWVQDQAGAEIQVLSLPGPPPQLLIISQHGCIYALDALDGNSLVSGTWGAGTLNLPDCNIDGGEVIYLNSANKLMGPPSKNFIVPFRLDVGIYDSGLGTVPADGTIGPIPLNFNYLNDQCRPVSFMPFVEMPTVEFNMGAANDWNVALQLNGTNASDPGWGGFTSNGMVRLNSPGATDIAWPPGFTLYPGPTIVNPGDNLQLIINWRFGRTIYNANGANRVRIFGPRMSFMAHAI